MRQETGDRSWQLFLEVGLWLPPSPHPIPHAALWVLLYTKYCTLNFLKKRNFRESGRAKGFQQVFLQEKMTSIFEFRCFLTMFDQPTICSVVGISNFFRKRNFKESVGVRKFQYIFLQKKMTSNFLVRQFSMYIVGVGGGSAEGCRAHAQLFCRRRILTTFSPPLPPPPQSKEVFSCYLLL